MANSQKLLVISIASELDRQGINISELARRAGIDRSHMHKYATGVTVPSLETLDKISAALGVSASDLLKSPQDRAHAPSSKESSLENRVEALEAAIRSRPMSDDSRSRAHDLVDRMNEAELETLISIVESQVLGRERANAPKKKSV